MDIEFRWLDIGGGRPLIPQLGDAVLVEAAVG
jgi:hypothetical protein